MYSRPCRIAIFSFIVKIPNETRGIFMSTNYAYVRVSSKEQHEERQLIAMRELGIPEKNIYIDKQSGKDFNRPQYKKLLRKVKEGDVIFVKSIDRLGRNYADILEQWALITKEKKTAIVVLDMPLLDTRDKNRDLMGVFISDLVLQILSYVAETEREFIKKRQAEGIAAAKARGVQFGRRRNVLSENFEEIYQLCTEGKLSLRKASKVLDLPYSTFYKQYIRRINNI